MSGAVWDGTWGLDVQPAQGAAAEPPVRPRNVPPALRPDRAAGLPLGRATPLDPDAPGDSARLSMCLLACGDAGLLDLAAPWACPAAVRPGGSRGRHRARPLPSRAAFPRANRAPGRLRHTCQSSHALLGRQAFAIEGRGRPPPCHDAHVVAPSPRRRPGSGSTLQPSRRRPGGRAKAADAAARAAQKQPASPSIFSRTRSTRRKSASASAPPERHRCRTTCRRARQARRPATRRALKPLQKLG